MDFYASQILYFSRKGAKLTPKALSEKTGIDKSYISRIENELVQPTVETFLKLLQAMGLSFDIGKTA
ncbi:helix-turn-helix domain-containing protein [Riemerella columbipharyngis]|uniref:Helix-turn-helix n=1 Tax=Riemerella columbipharyngis TaxID=1071918 RepID=A0A1G7BFD2_9FLAO|nr:helix-turn-helix transcriptional regulator [Riemerella columbipharyngis]SDE24945.1 Helix-turn-helix [Riemerella columbipharyngis]